MPTTNGYILWEGPSLLTQAPIVAIATGFINESRNEKTGPMIQVWILGATDAPLKLISNGQDDSICGECRHRASAQHARTCYVEVGRAPTQVWGAWKRGRYSTDRAPVEGRLVRLGAYGDPAAVPIDVWSELCGRATGWTGYTHQWRSCDQAYAQFCMASCDADAEREEARLRGYRVFRVTRTDDYSLSKGEGPCPASAEQDNLLTCARCMACSGVGANRHGDRVIRVHGTKGAIRAFDLAA